MKYMYPYPVFVTLSNTYCPQVAVAVKTLKTGSTVEEKIDWSRSFPSGRLTGGEGRRRA